MVPSNRANRAPVSRRIVDEALAHTTREHRNRRRRPVDQKVTSAGVRNRLILTSVTKSEVRPPCRRVVDRLPIVVIDRETVTW